MLVLTRRTDESFDIEVPGGDVITVRMLKCSPGRAKMGIEAPKEYKISRDELHTEEQKG